MARFARRERGYLQIAKFNKLDQIPKPRRFTIAAFPIEIGRATGPWVRAVAINEDETCLTES